MEDALTRLETAIKLAMAHYVLIAEDEFTNCKRRLAATLSVEGQRNGFDLITEVDGYEAFTALLPPVEERDGRPFLPAIWSDPRFIMPAVAALAQFFDRMVTPGGDSLLTLQVARDETALYGFRLNKLTMSAFVSDGEGGWQERALTQKDGRRASTMLAGAASFFLRDQQWMQFAPHYLHVEVNRSAPEGAYNDNIRGRASSFIELVSPVQAEEQAME